MLHGYTQVVSCSCLHANTPAVICSHLHGHTHTMEGGEESLQLRIDVSLDQDKDENQNQEIVYSQSAENSDVDVVTLESDYPPSSSSSDGTMSGPEHVELVSPTILPKVFRSASKRFTSLSFAERCYHIMNYLHSPESDRVYPFFITHKWDRQKIRKRTESFRWDECRQKLFCFYKDQFGL